MDEENKTGNVEPLSELAQVADNLKEAKAILEENRQILKEQRELASRNLLGGSTTSGIQPQAPKEETAKEYAERVLKNQVKK